MKDRKYKLLFFVLAVCALGVWVVAVNVPHIFTAGEIISAAEVNDNFGAVENAIDNIEDSYVRSLNGQTGELVLEAGSNISIDDSSPGKIIISTSGSGGGGGSSGDITAVNAGEGLTGGGDTADVTLSVAPSFRLPQTCANGEIAKWTGSEWVCATDQVGAGGGGGSGDITGVVAGDGLVGGGTEGTVALALNSAYRLPQSCSAGESIVWTGSAWACKAPTGVVGYAWVNLPTTANYTPHTSYSYNASGGLITAERSGTGTYTITFEGLEFADSPESVQVSAYDTPGLEHRYCNITGWGSGAGGWSVHVKCYDADGNPADSRYTILLVH